MDAKKIGQFIQKRRQELNLTQEELADRLYVSNKTISKWENGRGIPSVELLMPICEVLKVELKELLSGEKDSSYEDLLIQEMKKNKRNQFIKFITGIFFCLFLCFLEVVLYASNIDSKYGYILFGMIILLFLVFDISNYYINKK